MAKIRCVNIKTGAIQYVSDVIVNTPGVLALNNLEVQDLSEPKAESKQDPKPEVKPEPKEVSNGLSNHTAAELKAIAKEKGIKLAPGTKKADLIKLLS
jgi:hypothetical protein